MVGSEKRRVPEPVGCLSQLGERLGRRKRTTARQREAEMHAPHIARGPGACQVALRALSVSEVTAKNRPMLGSYLNADPEARVKPRILVVDDEAVIAENLRLTLQHEGPHAPDG